MDIKQVSDVVWEIPPSFKQGMNVPARIYATKELLEGMDRGVFEQVTNVAALPGIMRYSYAMADAHWGYGFPIGGVAAFDLEKGVISPGGIGFDVNCLHPSTKIYDEFGAWLRIDTGGIRDQEVLTFDTAHAKVIKSRCVLRLTRPENGILFRILTRCGKEVLTTGDHPLLTRRGMVMARDILADDNLVVNGFEGYEHETPPPLHIVSAEQLDRALELMGVGIRGSARGQTLSHLRRRGLERVTTLDGKFPLLLKLLGSIFGDGTIPRTRVGKYATFYGRREDLNEIQVDVKKLGFGSVPFSRKRHHRIKTRYGVSEFEFQEDSLMIPSTAFAALLVALGAPYGNKTVTPFRVPPWMFSLPSWQKRLFLAGYFGAELSKPDTNNGYNFEMPSFSVSKLRTLEENAISFLGDIKLLLESLQIQSSDPTCVEGYAYLGKYGESVGYRLSILSNTPNVLRLFSRVGFVYNAEKEARASLASLYLARLEQVRSERNEVRRKVREMYSSGLAAEMIVETLATENAGSSFVRHSIWGDRGDARVWAAEKFGDFIGRGLGSSGYIFDEIESIHEIPYSGDVFDLTVDDPNHNFVANGVVVSNCGMRLIRTNLRFAEVRPKVKELVDLLFRLVPAGVGVKGSLNLNQSQFEDIMRWGVKWCVEHDLGWDDDPSHVEEGGFIKGADPSKVSRQAISRGISQLGTLGSGNHYLEIQVVDPARFLDRELAMKFGIVHDDQVVVMIHCGSRGFGHQVCSDYLRVFDGAMKHSGIQVRDRELACAPFKSKEGQDYYGAMLCAANYAFANRQVILQRVREAFGRVFHKDAAALDMQFVYDVCHNVAKVEKHKYDGTSVEALVHRKGATRSFGPGHPDIPAAYRNVGQPVIIGGSMETGSYLLVGTEKAMNDTFGSTAHGSGRTMSRTAAKKLVRGDALQKKMQERGIYVKAATMEGLAEEAGMAYKDISQVVDTMDRAGISRKVAALRPIGNIKG